MSHAQIIDTIPSNIDSISSEDSVPSVNLTYASSQSLGSNVTYFGKDSIITYAQENVVKIYGDAWVKFENYELNNADLITIYMDKNEAVAEYIENYQRDPEEEDEEEEEEIASEEEQDDDNEFIDPYNDPQDNFGFDPNNPENRPDSTFRNNNSNTGGNPLAKPGIPHFSDGANEFDAKRMRYNFVSKKGIIYETVTEQQNMFIHGGRTKIVSEQLGPDSLQHTIYASKTLITSCNAEHPHYGIRSNKQKIIPGKEVIVGPSNLEIAGIPTPLWLPFGFYPMTTQPKSGLIFPSGYEYSPTDGFGLSDIGYYLTFGEYVDLRLTSEVYFKGRWGLRAQSNYKKRYKFSGSFNAEFLNAKRETINTNPETGERELSNAATRSFRITWSHSQDRAANPNQTFRTNVNFSTSRDHNQRAYTDFANVTNNSSNSSISYSRRLTSSLSLTANASSSQNFTANRYDLTLPSMKLTMKAINPFKRKNPVGPQVWYEKITLSYNSSFENKISNDSTVNFFDSLDFREIRNGIQHNATLGSNLKLLKYININPSVSIDENWYFNSIRKYYDEESSEIIDSTVQTFSTFRTLTSSLGMTTNLYQIRQWNKGWLRGVYHKMTPSVSISYAPANDQHRAFQTLIYSDSTGMEREDNYHIYENSIYRISASTGNFNITYGINSNIEAKFMTKEDTIPVKKSIISGLRFGGNVDLNRDSLKFIDPSFSANTTLIKNVSRLTVSGRLSFYDKQITSRSGSTQTIVDEFYWNNQKKLFRFESLSTNISTGFRISDVIGFLSGKDKKNEMSTIFDQMRIQHELRFQLSSYRDGNRNVVLGEITSNNLSLRGQIDISDKWSFNISNVGFDFNRKQITYPDFSINRDLHCWNLDFSYQPRYGTYSLNLRVKEGALNFIKIPYRKNQRDAEIYR